MSKKLLTILLSLFLTTSVYAADITRNTTLPDSADKADFHNLIDTAEVTTLADVDDDTQIQAEESSDEDIIRFDIGGTETVRFGDGTNEDLAQFTNAGTFDGVQVIQSGVNITGRHGLRVDSTVALVNANSALVAFATTSGSCTEPVLEVTQAGTGEGLLINLDGILAGSHYGLYVESDDAAQTNSPTVMFKSGHNDSTKPVVAIDADNNDASDKAIGLEINADNAGSGDQVALDIDQVDESKSYLLRVNATTAWTSAKDPEDHAEAGWLKIMVGSTAYFIPYYAAS